MTRTEDVHIAWLRQKMEADPANPQFILTVHGQGYRRAAQTECEHYATFHGPPGRSPANPSYPAFKVFVDLLQNWARTNVDWLIVHYLVV